MFVEIFSICDAATDYNGRLNILGAFEGIASTKAPVARDRCSIAVRVRFDSEETGAHSVEVRFVDREGNPVGPKMSANMQVKVRADRKSGAYNLVLNINRLQFPNFGDYDIQLWIDGERRSSIPLLVAKAAKRSRLGNSMEN